MVSCSAQGWLHALPSVINVGCQVAHSALPQLWSKVMSQLCMPLSGLTHDREHRAVSNLCNTLVPPVDASAQPMCHLSCCTAMHVLNCVT